MRWFVPSVFSTWQTRIRRLQRRIGYSVQMGGLIHGWSGPDRHDFFAIVLKALQEHGNTQGSLPPAPPIFRFSDPAECRDVLTRAGFVDASVIELPLKGGVFDQAILDCIYKGTVRTAAVLERQTPDAIDRIHRAIREGAERFTRDGTYKCLGRPYLQQHASHSRKLRETNSGEADERNEGKATRGST